MRSKTLPGLIFLSQTRSISSGRIAAHRGGAAVEVDVGEEQFLAIEFDPVRDADVAHVAARAGGADRLHHRLLRADALEHRVGADSLGQVLDAGHALVAALGHDVGRAEFAGELLPRLVTAHRDDPLGTHLLGGKHAEQADRAVTDDRDRRAGFTLAASAANQPVPSTSEAASRLGIRSSEGTPGVATRVPSASGTRSSGACAPADELPVLHDVW